MTTSDNNDMPSKTDVIVVGSGAGGLTAAITAALQGLNVTVLEAAEVFGGTTAYSGGGVWIPANHYQKDMGIDDSFEAAETYVKAVLGDEYDEAKQSAYIRTAVEMLNFLEEKTDVKMTGFARIPDYEPSEEGWSESRCLLSEPYDGAQMGDLLHKLRPPIKEMGLFNGMQLDPSDAVAMQQWKTSGAAFTLVLRRFFSYLISKLKHGRPTYLANGNALAARLLKSASDAGVTLKNNARVKQLIEEGEKVVGVEFESGGKSHSLRARKGVILASGGFGANPEMRAKYMPETSSGYNVQPDSCVGDGITMGQKVGGKFVTDNDSNAIWVPASRCQRDDGSTATFPSLFYDRHSPGTIMVDARTGKRFLNEGFHYQSFGVICREQGVEKIWMLADSRFVNKYGIGMAKPWPFSLKPWIKKGYLIEANSIYELAEKIGVDPKTLGETLQQFNKDAAEGKDTEFHRGEDAYSSYMGDMTHSTPGLAPLDQPPFYALDVRPSDLCSLAGLATNEKAQVLREDGSVIDGLYAVGIDANTVMRGFYPGGGTSIGPAMTFGYIAAKRLAEGS